MNPNSTNTPEQHTCHNCGQPMTAEDYKYYEPCAESYDDETGKPHVKGPCCYEPGDDALSAYYNG